MNLLELLHAECGTSPWLDCVRRSYVHSGRLGHLAKRGIRGAIRSPSLFEHMVWGSAEYDAQIASLSRRHVGVEEIYWELIISDVTAALAWLQPVYDASGGHDGFIVIDLPPVLAHDTTGIIATVRALYTQIRRPNLLVRIPATDAGIRALTRLTADGLGVVVDVVAPARYERVMEAYLSGLETCPGPLAGVHGVAAFDLARLEATGRGAPGYTGGQDLPASPNDGVTVARRAYSAFQVRFSGPRWGRLAHRGATPQRPLWFPPSPGPARSAVALTQQLAGRNCIVAVSDDVATGLERYESPAVAHCGLEDPSDVVAPMDVTDTGDEDLVRAQEANALETSRRAYDAVLATLRARVSTSD